MWVYRGASQTLTMVIALRNGIAGDLILVQVSGTIAGRFARIYVKRRPTLQVPA